MDRLKVKNFFSINSYKHLDLWEKKEYVWEAVSALSSYIHSLKLGVIQTDIPQGVYLENAELISIGEGTLIEPGVYIKGPCVIGSRCILRQGAYVREDVLIGNGCVIGHATELKHSILFDDVAAAHFNYVGDSIVGNKVNLGAGAKCANVRLDNSPISFYLEGKKIETGLRKLGAIVGDGVHIGCNAVTSPGTLIGKGACIYPCLHVKGYIAQKTLIKKMDA